jgi:hypothetical protein
MLEQQFWFAAKAWKTDLREESTPVALSHEPDLSWITEPPPRKSTKALRKSKLSKKEKRLQTQQHVEQYHHEQTALESAEGDIPARTNLRPDVFPAELAKGDTSQQQDQRPELSAQDLASDESATTSEFAEGGTSRQQDQRPELFVQDVASDEPATTLAEGYIAPYQNMKPELFTKDVASNESATILALGSEDWNLVTHKKTKTKTVKGLQCEQEPSRKLSECPTISDESFELASATSTCSTTEVQKLATELSSLSWEDLPVVEGCVLHDLGPIDTARTSCKAQAEKLAMEFNFFGEELPALDVNLIMTRGRSGRMLKSSTPLGSSV